MPRAIISVHRDQKIPFHHDWHRVPYHRKTSVCLLPIKIFRRVTEFAFAPPCRYLDNQRGFLSSPRTRANIAETRSLLKELDDAVARGSPERRLRALWHATDLLIAGTYTEDQIWTFGEVIGILASEIEVAARAQLAKRLARIDGAPINVVKKLAFDDSIDVAGPILRHSERLDVKTLVANVRTKSQSHLLAISHAKSGLPSQ